MEGGPSSQSRGVGGGAPPSGQTVHPRYGKDRPLTDLSPALDQKWQKKSRKMPNLKKKKVSETTIL